MGSAAPLVRLLAVALLCGGCVGPTSLHIETEAATGVLPATCTVAVVADGVEIAARDYPDRANGPIVGSTDVLLADRDQSLAVHVFATDRTGRRFEAQSTVVCSAHRQTNAHFVIGDALPALCRDGARSGDESDLDCGGASCPGCAVHAACARDADCQTSHCVDQRCALASGPPSWIQLGDAGPSNARYDLAAALDSTGRPYALGGSAGGTVTATVEYLDLSSSIWIHGDDLPVPMAKHRAVRTTDGRIFVAGGDDADQPLAFVSSDPSTAQGNKSWTAFAPSPSARRDQALIATSDGTLYAIGGRRGGSAVDDGEMFKAGSWMPIPTMLEARCLMGGALGNDGSIYLFGGYQFAPLSSIDRWAPGDSRWTRSAAMVVPARVRPVALAAPDGRIYVMGGEVDSNEVANVLAFTPSDNGLDAASNLVFARTGFAGVALDDGRLLVIGSTSGSMQPSELYGPSVTLTSPSGGAVGTEVTVAGRNFAANAAVHVYLDDQHVATTDGTTDSTGGLSGLSFRVPALPAGMHRVRVVDEHSRYPVRSTLVIAP
jgi:hypothetical protein